jgi:hypothetical protein
VCAKLSVSGLENILSRTGALLSHLVGSRKNHELPLLRQQHDQFQQLGVDSVISLGVRKPVATASALAVLAHNDLLIQWPKPKWNKTASYSKEEWQRLTLSVNGDAR